MLLLAISTGLQPSVDKHFTINIEPRYVNVIFSVLFSIDDDLFLL